MISAGSSTALRLIVGLLSALRSTIGRGSTPRPTIAAISIVTFFLDLVLAHRVDDLVRHLRDISSTRDLVSGLLQKRFVTLGRRVERLLDGLLAGTGSRDLLLQDVEQLGVFRQVPVIIHIRQSTGEALVV